MEYKPKSGGAEEQAKVTKKVELTQSEWEFLQQGRRNQLEVQKLLGMRN